MKPKTARPKPKRKAREWWVYRINERHDCIPAEAYETGIAPGDWTKVREVLPRKKVKNA